MKLFLPIVAFFMYSCTTQINYPEGGCDYPKYVSGSDSNIFYYPLKDSFPRGKKFLIYNQSFFFGAFDEPNLSIKPLDKETFRLTWSSSFGHTAIISINEDVVIIKKANVENAYERDTTTLSKTDSFLSYLLMKYYPIDSANPKYLRQKKYLDSLIKLYPQLVDQSYYAKFFERIPVKDQNFHYQLIKIPITKQQFKELAEKIKASGYWQLPIQWGCSSGNADGAGYTLEANTSEKYQLVFSGPCTPPAFEKICFNILELAKMDFKSLYK